LKMMKMQKMPLKQHGTGCMTTYCHNRAQKGGL
jgi:hypothetical protein